MGGKAVYGCCQNMQVFYKNSISLGKCFVTREQFGPFVSLWKQQDKELSRDWKQHGEPFRGVEPSPLRLANVSYASVGLP